VHNPRFPPRRLGDYPYFPFSQGELDVSRVGARRFLFTSFGRQRRMRHGVLPILVVMTPPTQDGPPSGSFLSPLHRLIEDFLLSERQFVSGLATFPPPLPPLFDKIIEPPLPPPRGFWEIPTFFQNACPFFYDVAFSLFCDTNYQVSPLLFFFIVTVEGTRFVIFSLFLEREINLLFFPFPTMRSDCVIPFFPSPLRPFRSKLQFFPLPRSEFKARLPWIFRGSISSPWRRCRGMFFKLGFPL